MLNDGQARIVEIVTDDPDADYDLGEEEEDINEEDDMMKTGKKRKNRDCLSKSKRKPFVTEYGTPPEFKKPKDKLMKLSAGYLGHMVSLKCPHRKGCPKAKLEWFRDGDPVVASKTNMGRSLVTINKKGDLTIVDNRMEDDGIYTCLISNKFGMIRHDIKVQAVPRVVAHAPELSSDQPGNHSLIIGSNLTMKCEVKVVDSTNPHVITWYKHFTVNGAWADEEHNVYVEELQTTSSHLGDDSKLILTNITQEDAGWYSCTVKNQFGALVSYGHLNVTQPLPNPETQFPSFYIYLSISIAGGMGLCFFIVVVVTCVKYRREKKLKLLAVENAQSVARWTKKVIIERNFVAEIGGDPEDTLSPCVRVEKVLTTAEAGSEENEEVFEFQMDEVWEFDREKLTVKEELGQGAFGKVMKGTIRGAVITSELTTTSGCHLAKTSKNVPALTVAVKMTKDNATEQEVLDLVKEIEIMKAVGGHVNIVNLLGACTQPAGQPLLAILEFAEHGNLRDYLRRRRGFCSRQSGDHLDTATTEPRPVGLKEMLSFAWQVARGMEFLATRRCVHRDLAARNVLIAKGGVAKVADFGLARDVEQSDYYRKVTEGKLPVLWMSPESLFDGVSSTKSDVWSYGVLLWEIVTCGERPYTGVATEALLDLIKDGYRMSIPLQCPQNLYQIMKSCWFMKPDSRPSWTELVDQLLSLYHSTLPGVYLDLALPSIPTPPSSAENSDCSQEEVNASVYNTVTSTVSGIAPLPRAIYNRAFTRTKLSISSSVGTEDLFTDEAERSVGEERDPDQGESEPRSRDSLESGYSSGVTEAVTKVLYYNEISATPSHVSVEVNVDS